MDPLDRMDSSKNASKYTNEAAFPGGRSVPLESALADTRREAKVAETEMSTEMKLKIAGIPSAVASTAKNAAAATATAASQAATTVASTAKSAASATVAAAGNATQWIGEKKDVVVEKVSNALSSNAPSANRNMDLPTGVTPNVVPGGPGWTEWIADKASTAGHTIADTASAAGGVLAHQAEAVGETLERAAEKAARTTHDTFASVTGANKRLVVSYLTGLSNGRWEGSPDAIHEDYVFHEKDGFQGGKDFIMRELNRRDRDASGTFDVWDGGNTFAFRMKTTLQYPRSAADPEVSNKRVECTAYGVLTVQDGRILIHEQRSDHFKPSALALGATNAAEPSPAMAGKY